jgi:hypothetical protein
MAEPTVRDYATPQRRHQRCSGPVFGIDAVTAAPDAATEFADLHRGDFKLGFGAFFGLRLSHRRDKYKQ